jgi:signal transduction histidine kinase
VRSRRRNANSATPEAGQRSTAQAAAGPAQAANRNATEDGGGFAGGQSLAGNGAAGSNGAAADTAPDPAARPDAAAPAAQRPSRYSLKNWRVRSRLLLLVVVPTLAAVILGAVSVVSSVRTAVAYQRVEQLAKLGGAITGLAQALQAERQDTIRFITLGAFNGGRGAPEKPPPGSLLSTPDSQLSVLHQDYRNSDQQASQVKNLAAGIGSSYPALAQQEAQSAITAIDGLKALRNTSTTTRVPSAVVIQKYENVINQLLTLEDEIAAGSNDAALADSVRVVSLISGMKEEVSQQQAILTSSLSTDLVGAAGVQPSQLAALNAAQAQQQADLTQFNLTASDSERQTFNSALSTTQADRAQAQLGQAASLANTGGFTTANPAFTNAASGAAYLVTGLRSVEQGFMDKVIDQSNSLRGQAITLALAGGAAVMLVLVLALILTTAVARSMTRPLRRLRTGALEVAGVRLPETVRQMTSSDGADLPLEVEPIDVDSTDEIGEVARAFDHVHREAVRLASNEAALRGNINAMFVNLSRRSQSLVERQIRLIDDLEQGEQDSERLGNLFQMDHLATRMRRNSENLLVLAGHELTRRWTEPVPLVDVLRAAVSEIEQYERVTLNVQPGIAVRGPAVNDVVHLLAELAENATSFSAAETPVNISGHLLNSGGVLLDITDQGVGMHTEEMAHANWRLDNPPVVDVAVSRRMGLFVVARLAARHGIRVRLRPASMGGLTALVWLPDEVITHETTGAPAGFRRFELPVPGADAEAGGRTGAWPGAAATDDRSATVQALTAARAPRFAPLRPDLGDTSTNAFTAIGSDDTASADGGGAGQEQAGAGALSAADAAAPPAADSGAMPVFGAPLTGDVAGLAHDELSLASFGAGAGAGTGTELSDADQGVVVPPAVGVGEENRLPIFESVESDWFRRGRHGADRVSARADTAVSSTWTSPADEGWRAAEVAHAPVAGGTTGAGLPKRVPKANLVPGGVGAAAAAPAAPARSAAQTRDRLSSFQRGIREARVAAREDDSPPSGEEDGANS